jgi:hypothetical protein
MQKQKAPTLHSLAKIPARDGTTSLLGAGTLPAGANGARVEGFMSGLVRARHWLSGVVIPITAANDFGGVKISDLQNQNLMAVAAAFSLIGAVTAPNVGTELTVAVGSAVASNATLSAAMIDYVNGKTGVGAAQAFTAVGHSFDNTGGNFGNAGATPFLLDNHATNNDLFLNVAATVASGTCNVTFGVGSYVDLFYFDLDEPVVLT